MFTKLYTVIIAGILSVYYYFSWILIGRWSKLNRLANRLEALKHKENKLCSLLQSLNDAYLQQSKEIQTNRQQIALERLQILEQIGKISVPETQPKSCEILQAPKVKKNPKKATINLVEKSKNFLTKKTVPDVLQEGVQCHMINGTNSFIDLLVDDTVQQFRDTQNNDEKLIRELYNDPAWKPLINDIKGQFQLFSYLGGSDISK